MQLPVLPINGPSLPLGKARAMNADVLTFLAILVVPPESLGRCDGLLSPPNRDQLQTGQRSYELSEFCHCSAMVGFLRSP